MVSAASVSSRKHSTLRSRACRGISKALKDAGILTDRKEGRWVYYALARDTFDEAESVLTILKPNVRRLPTRSSGCC